MNNQQIYSIQFSGILLPEFDTKKALFCLLNVLKIEKETIRMIVLTKHKNVISGISNDEANYFIDLFLDNGLIFYKRKLSNDIKDVSFINNSNTLSNLHGEFINNLNVKQDAIIDKKIFVKKVSVLKTLTIHLIIMFLSNP